MSELRAGLPPLPSRMQTLRVDARGYPVPWFVAWVGDTPDFRVVKPNAMVEALRFHLCWICGQQLGRHRAFVIGPMCAINRISSEPPSHCDCAHFAAQACPFLTIPSSHRRESGLEDLGAVDPAGFAIKRNPGVALVWVTKSFRPFRAERGVLIRVGDPHELHWYAEGREATAEEVAESIGTGFPILWREAQAESPEAVDELDRALDAALPLLPCGAPELLADRLAGERSAG